MISDRILKEIDLEIAYAKREITESEFDFMRKNIGLLLEDVEDSEIGTRADELRDQERAEYMLNQVRTWNDLVSSYPELDNNVKVFMQFGKWFPSFINENDYYPTIDDAEKWYTTKGYLFDSN